MAENNGLGIWKALTGLASSVALICVIAVGTMWNNQRDLLNWKNEQWPLEKRLLLVEHEQQAATIEVLRMRITDLEHER